MTVYVPLDAREAWLIAAHDAGHPVVRLRSGLWRHPIEDAFPALDPGVPNDLLDLARQRAQEEVIWWHALMPSSASATALCLALRAGIETPVGRMAGGKPKAKDFARLVAEARALVGPWTVTAHVDGEPVHVVQIPAHLLTQPPRRP